jgi:hypothetical protein
MSKFIVSVMLLDSSFHRALQFSCFFSITKQRQWRRPEPESQPVERPMSIKEAAIENVVDTRRASRRISTRMVLGQIPSSPIKSKAQQEEEERKAIREMFNHTIDLVAETVARARRVSNMIMSEELLGDAELDEGAMDTVSYMMRIGTREKTGYLMKQSKLLGRLVCLSFPLLL